MTALWVRIWMKGTGEWENLLPDTTFNDKTRHRKPGPDAAVSRRHLKDIISGHRKESLNAVDNEDDSRISDMAGSISLKNIAIQILRAAGVYSIVRRNNNKKNNDGKQILRRQQDYKIAFMNKLREIQMFLEVDYEFTDFILREVRRIQETQVVKDQLILMIESLSHPDMYNVREAVFQCFIDNRNAEREVDIWKNRVVNNLILDPYKDHK